MSNVLDLVDQTIFRVERAAGVTNLIQCVWVYNSAIDFDGLRRFHHHLKHGRLSRRIERSPLLFGRHRWVSPSEQPELEIVATPRPREEFNDWLDEQANTPLDAEHGPGWHLAMLPFTDGGTGVSLVASHCLADGVGLSEAVAAAACGDDNAIDWPAPESRRRWQALREDARQTVRDMPAIGRAIGDAARFVRNNRDRAESAAPLPRKPPPPTTGATAATRGQPPRHLRRPPEPTSPSLSQRQRFSSTPTSGTPARSRSEGPATRCSRHSRPASPRDSDEWPQTARSP